MNRITKNTTLFKAIKAAPGAARVLDSFGMGCKSCSGARHETVEWGAMCHGVDVGELVRKLNEAVRSAKR